MTATQLTGGLYVADIQDIREGDTSGFDHVVGVCQDDCSDNVGCEYTHFDLRDGPYDSYGRGEFSRDMFKDAVDAVIAARIRRETVCVHCHMGQSRSASVAITAYALLEGISWEDARKKLEQKRTIHPNKKFVGWGKEIVEGDE
jgi:hypothetical protein